MKAASEIQSLVKKIPGSLYRALRPNNTRNTIDTDSLNQQLQKILINQYTDFFARGRKPYSNVAEAGFRCYSQFEEDGIILYILSAIGMSTKKVVEICCGDGTECMATNLILNQGYEGFLFDGDAENVSAANRFFKNKKDCLLTPPKVQQGWITKENINALLCGIGATGEVDLLSLDIDGNDYYVWEAITEIRPRLCVFETHNIVPKDLSLTIPYDPNFCYRKTGPEQDFRSVSLSAMKKLSESKGYRLIGGHKHGFNVFFMRNDMGQDLFPSLSIEEVHNNLWTRIGQSERWPLVKDMPWVEV